MKVGDYVKFTNGKDSIVFKIDELGFDYVTHLFQDEGEEPFNLDYCTKLTDEQIKILGLEG